MVLQKEQPYNYILYNYIVDRFTVACSTIITIFLNHNIYKYIMIL